ncbi:hypothetical protein SAMN05192529_101304 [Arachidicoccus rhizosphaerae]|jgi:hypothetical protein|uniref:DUF2255 family protein n=1 Tax=Arachidicoccus rhizosphaerae TaxID=551991 RepID=A0A1H3VNA0_9BACT|nr:DUF2255 family protein [Arachidicoccus rhizosphaerae]SDZ76240.1 hypothetical protein SAMN05192529_101304 [Arachidicoccus rhizosphaerae]
MDHIPSSFSSAELQNIDKADDLKISPLRADGKTYGTPTWIWEVVVDHKLFVRAYSGTSSSWYKAAVSQGAGRIHAAGNIWNVRFEIADEALQDTVDTAYRKKYASSPYLSAMIGQKAKQATIQITGRH